MIKTYKAILYGLLLAVSNGIGMEQPTRHVTSLFDQAIKQVMPAQLCKLPAYLHIRDICVQQEIKANDPLLEKTIREYCALGYKLPGNIYQKLLDETLNYSHLSHNVQELLNQTAVQLQKETSFFKEYKFQISVIAEHLKKNIDQYTQLHELYNQCTYSTLFGFRNIEFTQFTHDKYLLKTLAIISDPLDVGCKQFITDVDQWNAGRMQYIKDLIKLAYNSNNPAFADVLLNCMSSKVISQLYPVHIDELFLNIDANLHKLFNYHKGSLKNPLAEPSLAEREQQTTMTMILDVIVDTIVISWLKLKPFHQKHILLDILDPIKHSLITVFNNHVQAKDTVIKDITQWLPYIKVMSYRDKIEQLCEQKKSL